MDRVNNNYPYISMFLCIMYLYFVIYTGTLGRPTVSTILPTTTVPYYYSRRATVWVYIYRNIAGKILLDYYMHLQ